MLAYETYGRLNDARSNAILVCHALSGDAHAAGHHEGDDRPGWWDGLIGPGKALDTDRFFVICSNVIGGCQGSTGPSSIDPETGRPYGSSFPVITVRDMVAAQRALVAGLGIGQLYAVIGGSMGGMQALQWIVSYPDAVLKSVIIAATATSSPQQIAFNEIGRRAIMTDPAWNGGDYVGREEPEAGLALARMIGHVTYLSDESMHEKFGRRLQRPGELRVRLRDRLRGRVVPPPPGRVVHAPVRRELVPLHHQGPRLLRPLGRRFARGRPRRG